MAAFFSGRSDSIPSPSSPPADGDPSPVPPRSTELQLLREITTAILAFVLVIGFVVLMVAAFDKAGSTFDNVKDLLAVATPIVSVVVGYYFGKSTGEGRAEAAERTSQAVTQVAVEAAAGEESAKREGRETRDVLREVVRAADASLGNPAPRALPGDEPVRQERLRDAVERARWHLG